VILIFFVFHGFSYEKCMFSIFFHGVSHGFPPGVQAEVLTSFGCSEETIASVTDESAEEVKQHADARQMVGR